MASMYEIAARTSDPVTATLAVADAINTLTDAIREQTAMLDTTLTRIADLAERP